MPMSEMTYSTVSMGLRAPRVVIVFDGGSQWTYWAQRGLHLAGKIWGGAGFALVPHRAGVVSATLLRACRAYDPDFVVLIPTTRRELEQLSRGGYQEDRWGELPAAPAQQDFGLDVGVDHPLYGKADEQARQAVKEACSPYRLRLSGDLWRENVRVLAPGVGAFALAHNLPDSWRGSVLTCPSTWGGLMGVALASRLGIAGPPAVTATESDYTSTAMWAISKRWFNESTVSWPKDLIWSPQNESRSDSGTVLEATAASLTGLSKVYHGPVAGRRAPRTMLGVVGDEPEDFALARLWELTFGSAIWLPSVFNVERDDPPMVGKARLNRMVNDLKEPNLVLGVTSVSRGYDAIESIVERLELGPDAVRARAWEHQVLPWEQPFTTHYGVDEQFDEFVAVPTIMEPMGSRVMAAPLPPPVLRSLSPLPVGELVWHVDVSWKSSALVAGRGLDGDELCTPDSPSGQAWVRSGRSAISFQSKRADFVLNGTTEVNRLARPLLRDLSLEAWVHAIGRTRSLAVRRSEAGQRTALLERMFGSREAFVEFFAGPMLSALLEMTPKSSKTTKAYPEGDGVVLNAREGVLTFERFRKLMPERLSDAGVRDLLDSALQAGVLRWGLVLGCPKCEQKQFQAIDKVGQTWTCVRCDERCDLNRRAWKMPEAEPTWFFDLHPVGRHILQDHGEVASLLSKVLQAELLFSQPYQDVEGLELLDNGVPQVELDLVAYVRDCLVIGECKSSNQLSHDTSRAKAEVLKKCRAVQWLRADVLVFATTERAWNDRTLNLIRSGVTSFDWGNTGAPEVRVATGLGTVDQKLELLPVARAMAS